MKVFAITRSYADLHGSNIVCVHHEKTRSEKILGMINEGIEDTHTYKIEELEVSE